MSGFDAVHQLDGFALRAGSIEPAARDHQGFRDVQHAVRDGIAVMVIIEKPGVKASLMQSSLDCFQVHRAVFLFKHILLLCIVALVPEQTEGRYSDPNPTQTYRPL